MSNFWLTASKFDLACSILWIIIVWETFKERRFLIVSRLMACAGSDGALMILSSH